MKKVERWVEQNGETVLGRTIKEMTKRQKEKNRKRKDLLRSVGHGGNNNSVNDSNGNNGNNNNSNVNVNNANSSTTPLKQPLIKDPTTTLTSSLHMLITKDENSDLAIW